MSAVLIALIVVNMAAMGVVMHLDARARATQREREAWRARCIYRATHR